MHSLSSVIWVSSGEKSVVFLSDVVSSATIMGVSLGALAESMAASRSAYSSRLVVKAFSICFKFSGDMLTDLFLSTPLLMLVPLERIERMLPLLLVLEWPLATGFNSIPSLPSTTWIHRVNYTHAKQMKLVGVPFTHAQSTKEMLLTTLSLQEGLTKINHLHCPDHGFCNTASPHVTHTKLVAKTLRHALTRKQDGAQQSRVIRR